MLPWSPERALARIEELKPLQCALLPILHALHEDFGYIHPAAVPLVAGALNLSKAEVYGVISFYHDFRTEPCGRHTFRMCRAEACQAMGGDQLIQHTEQRLGIKLNQTTPDGSVTLQQVFCLGNCALSPSVMLDGQPYGRVSPQLIDHLLDRTRSAD